MGGDVAPISTSAVLFQRLGFEVIPYDSLTKERTLKERKVFLFERWLLMAHNPDILNLHETFEHFSIEYITHQLFYWERGYISYDKHLNELKIDKGYILTDKSLKTWMEAITSMGVYGFVGVSILAVFYVGVTVLEAKSVGILALDLFFTL